MKSFKRALSMLLCLMMVLSAVAVSADTLGLTVDSNSYITNATFEPVQGGTTGLTKVTIPYTASTSPKYISLLAYTAPTAQETMIGNAVALEQYTHSDANGNAVFYIINPADNSTLEIKMGGSGLSAVNAKLLLAEKPWDGDYTIKFYYEIPSAVVGESATIVEIGDPVVLTQANKANTITIPAAPVRQYYAFDKYIFADDDGLAAVTVDGETTTWADHADNSTGIVEVKAIYNDFFEHTVSIGGYADTVEIITVGGKIPADAEDLPTEAPTSAGQFFAGWDVDGNTENGAEIANLAALTTYDFGEAAEQKATKTITPMWTDAPKVTFKYVDDTAIGEPVSVNAEGKILETAVPTSLTIPQDKEFKGWATSKDATTGKTASEVAADTYSENTVFYAIFGDPAPSYTLGDVDGEPGITVMDARAVARHAAKIELITDPTYLLAADVDGEPGITVMDARAIARHAAKIELIGSSN